MPFDFKKYDEKCNGLTQEQLQREWDHYTRLISSASTSTAISGAAIPMTLGVSAVGIAMAAPAIHNARKKRAIIERHLREQHGATHVTRKRDVLGSMAVSGAVGLVTLGAGAAGGEALVSYGAEHGVAAAVEHEAAVHVAAHAGVEGAAMAAEHARLNHRRDRAEADADTKARAAGAIRRPAEKEKARAVETSIYPVQPTGFSANTRGVVRVSSPMPWGQGNTYDPSQYQQQQQQQQQARSTIYYEAHPSGQPGYYPTTPAYVVSSVPVSRSAAQPNGPTAEGMKSMATAISAVEWGPDITRQQQQQQNHAGAPWLNQADTMLPPPPPYQPFA